MNNRILHFILVLLLCLVFVAPAALSAEKEQKSGNGVAKVTGTPTKTYLNINNISTVLGNDGDADIDIQKQNSGLVFPKGSRKTAMFESGFLWGARYGVGGEVRVGGSAYRQALQGGKILSLGVAEDPDLAKNRIYRVRPLIGPNADITKVEVTSEINDGEGSRDAIIAQYLKDWNEWPAADGAPFEDKNGNGTYEPAADVPGVKAADQTIWFVANDLNASLTTFLAGSNPMGVELQVTIWAYAQTGALGNMFFKKYLIINKSNTIFDSTFVTQWADPDLGNSADDFAGCDTTRSLGYVYNANAVDDTYKPLPPPASGFDFFQGPLVAGAATDSAIFKGKRVYGKKNLPMTAFYYFARGDASVVDPTQGAYNGTIEWYNFIQGKIGRTGQIFNTPDGVPTTFVLSGDPQTRQGWVDGQLLPAGDRRIGLASGPFTMAPGDTQEVVVAEICAGALPGTDRLSCIGLLKFYDDQAQLAYNNFFDLPIPPPTPKVTPVELDRQIVLNWGADLASAATVENAASKGYAFQGYNVYQLPSTSATLADAKRLATYDIVDGIGKIEDFVFDASTGVVAKKVIQFGNDNGIQRFFSIKTDELNGGTPLINGTRYFFAVTAYNYNPAFGAVPNNLETPLAILTIVPHSPNPGTSYALGALDTVKGVVQVTALGGAPSEGVVLPLVVDPSKLTGHSYKVTVDTLGGATIWNLLDVTAGTTLLTNQTNLTGDNTYPIVDGLQIRVTGPPTPGMKDWQIPNSPPGARRWTFADADGYAFEGFLGAIGWDDPAHFFGVTAERAVGPGELRNVLVKLATASSGATSNPTLGASYGGWDVNTTTDPNMSYAYRYLRAATSAAARPEFGPFIVNATAGYAFQDYKKSVPFSAWNVEVTPPQRLAVGHLENNVASGLVDGRWWPPQNGALFTNTGGPREYFFIFNSPYTDATPDASLQKDILNNALPVMWFGTVNRRGGADFSQPPLASGDDQFLIIANHILTKANSFTFTAPANTVNDATLAKASIGEINVFPNPYYGVNSQEINKYQRFVTFSHLPTRAVVRIFNLAGIMVRRIDKDDASQFLRWDLANDSGLPVGSGLYIAYVEMPDIGAKKIVKIAVVQEQQVLDRF